MNTKDILLEALHVAEEVKKLTRFIELKLESHRLVIKNDIVKFNFFISKDDYKEYLNGLVDVNEIEKYTFFEKINIKGWIKNHKKEYYIGKDIISGGGEFIKNADLKNTTSDRADILIDNPVIVLRLGVVNGKPYPPAYNELIQHEVSHLYETIKKYHKKNYGYPKNTARLLEKYNIAKLHVNSHNWIARIFSEIYYYLDRGEQVAWANGLYSSLINDKPYFTNDEDLYDNYLANTRQYQQLEQLKKFLKVINNFNEDEDWEEAKTLFFEKSHKSLTNDQIKRSIKSFLQKEIPNFEQKLAGVVKQYKKDMSFATEETNRYKKRFMDLLN